MNAKKSFSKFKTLKNPLNCFLAICYVTFGEIDSLEYHKTEETDNYLSLFDSLLLNKRKRKSRIKLKYRDFFIKDRLSILYKSLFDKEYRVRKNSGASDADAFLGSTLSLMNGTSSLAF